MTANKSLGQHWLTDRNILNTIAAAARTDTTADLCLEIGPGLGTLTSSLLKSFHRVIAVEFDPRLAQNLPKSFPGKNLDVINQDFLKFDLSTIDTPYVVAGNIPYYISTPIIKHILSAPRLPEKIVLLTQKEFAEKLVRCESPLGFYLANLARLEQGIVVKKDFFSPPPKVDSAVLTLIPRPAPLYPDYSTTLAPLIVRAFAAPRKKLITNLASLAPKPDLERYLSSLHLSPDARPADLSLADYAALAKVLKTQYNI